MDMNTLKVIVNEEFINELITKSWQEIENLQNQITVIDLSTEKSRQVHQLLKNLLVSYYVFAGGLENFNEVTEEVIAEKPEIFKETIIPNEKICEKNYKLNNINTETYNNSNTKHEYEPFEYFIDFDDPIGQPLSDKDLYNN